MWNWNLLTRVGSVNMSLFVFVLPFLLLSVFLTFSLCFYFIVFRVSRSISGFKKRSGARRVSGGVAASCRFATTFQASSVLCRGQRGEEECRVLRFPNWRDASKIIRKDRPRPPLWTIFQPKIMEKWIRRGTIYLKWKYYKRWHFCLVFVSFCLDFSTS